MRVIGKWEKICHGNRTAVDFMTDREQAKSGEGTAGSARQLDSMRNMRSVSEEEGREGKIGIV